MSTTSPLRIHADLPPMGKQLTGVYAGHWRQAFDDATAFLAAAVTVPVSEPYGVLITIDSTSNHYQAAKAAIGALPILKAV